MTCLFNLSEFSDDVTCGIIRTKKLPPPGEATHTTVNILCIANFQILFTPIIFHYLGQYIIASGLALWSVGSLSHKIELLVRLFSPFFM